jgi:hypothetical protein
LQLTNIYPSIHLSIHPSTHLSIHPSIHPSIYPSICLPACLSVCLSICFSMVPQLLVFRRHVCRFTISSYPIFPSFVTPSTSFPHFTSFHPRCLHFPGDQAIIRLSHLLSSMRATCPYHFKILSSFLPNIFCGINILSLIPEVLRNSPPFLAILSQNSLVSVFLCNFLKL